ncbi:MAG: glycosyltransferase family 2 protein [Bacteroidetes bacterium]|nr:glycosyltransferase family 2 protein [Bacteroidota bacterium]
MIRISVIIPNYNHAPFLQQRIESVLSQTNAPAEVILLDDASTDESVSIIEKFRQHPLVSHICINEKNSGSPFQQWQKGVSIAKYEWVWLAESDDHCQPYFLEKAAAAILEHPGAGIFYCDSVKDPGNTLFSTEKNRFFQTDKWNETYSINGKAEIASWLGLRCTINNASAVLIRKDLLLECIREVSQYRYHGDWFCYLYAAYRSDILYSPEPMNTYRVHSSGISGSLPEDGRDQTECFRILSYIQSLTDIDTKQLIKRFTLVHLRSGLISGRKQRQPFYGINNKLARRVFAILLKNRFSFNTKKNA